MSKNKRIAVVIAALGAPVLICTAAIGAVTSGSEEPLAEPGGTQTTAAETQVPDQAPPLTLEAIRTVGFTDVGQADPWADSARYLTYTGVLLGVGNGRFGPERLCSRAVLLTVLQRLSGEAAPDYEGSFADVAADSWYAGAVAWAEQAGILIQNKDNRADPEGWITRAQLAQILVSYAGRVQGEPLAQELCASFSAKTVTSASRANHSVIQSAVDSAATRYGAVGLQVAVIEDGVVTDTYVYGWATKDRTAMTAEHKIRVASISKIAVGMCAMLLREEGVIDLDQSIGTYWGVTMVNPYYKKDAITMRALLSHTSSVRAMGDDVSRSYSAVKQALSGSAGYSKTKPGAISSWNYNNYGFGVLGMTLELAANRTVDAVLAEDLFQPLTIDASFAAGSIRHTELLTTLYYGNRSVSRTIEKQKSLVLDPCPGASGAYFAGGLTISAADLAKLTAVLINDGCYEGVRLLTSESVRLMERIDPTKLAGGFFQALPLRYQTDIYGRKALYYHTGSAYGVYNCLSYDPETGDGVVVLSVGASGKKDGNGIYSVCGEISRYIYEKTA